MRNRGAAHGQLSALTAGHAAGLKAFRELLLQSVVFQIHGLPSFGGVGHVGKVCVGLGALSEIAVFVVAVILIVFIAFVVRTPDGVTFDATVSECGYTTSVPPAL